MPVGPLRTHETQSKPSIQATLPKQRRATIAHFAHDFRFCASATVEHTCSNKTSPLCLFGCLRSISWHGAVAEGFFLRFCSYSRVLWQKSKAIPASAWLRAETASKVLRGAFTVGRISLLTQETQENQENVKNPKPASEYSDTTFSSSLYLPAPLRVPLPNTMLSTNP